MNRVLTVNLYNPNPSKIAQANGPLALDQINALINDNYWTVLGVHRFDCEAVKTDAKLCVEVNGFKHSLQTYGPLDSKQLPDFRSGKGKTKGCIFHGHVRSSQGLEYIIEWTVLDSKKMIIGIIGFAKHENFHFTQKPLSDKEKLDIITDPKNKKVLDRVPVLKKQAKVKANRIHSHQPFKITKG